MGKQYVDSIFLFIEIQCRGHVVKTLVMWMVPRYKIFTFAVLHVIKAIRYTLQRIPTHMYVF